MVLHHIARVIALFALCGGVGLTVLAVISVAEFGGELRRSRQRWAAWKHERHCAEQSIRDLKRAAIRQMLEVEHAERAQIEHYADVIEGTAVEIEPR
jgi:hypothetical protein